MKLLVAPLLFALAVGHAGARDNPCRPDGRSQAQCPGKAKSEAVQRRARPRLPLFETEKPGGTELERPPAAPMAMPPPQQPAAPLPAPAPITACDPNGCRDSSGTRYNGWGPGMIRSDGKLCQQVGNMMQCN